MDKIYSYFENLEKENKIVQAFLIGNVLFDDIKDELKKVFNKFFFPFNIELEENPDVYILKSEDGIITRDMIRTLLKNISITSQISNNKIYIIDSAEKLSDNVYNSILKTLEEPQKGIYAFLITKNIDAVKPTIVSRCQKIFLKSTDNTNEFDEEIRKFAVSIIKDIELNAQRTIATCSNIYKKIEDRNKFIIILKVMFEIYRKALYTIIDEKSDTEYNYITKYNDKESISKKLIVIDSTLISLNNYLNKNLSIDRFIIDMWRCA